MQTRRTLIRGAAGVAGSLAASRVLGANDRIRVGMIGPGMRGTQLLGHLVKQPNVEMAGFADVYTRRLEDAKKVAPAAKTYLDYRNLLDDKSVDAVVIATPQHLHREHFVASMQAGKHVYQEKTMAFSVQHAKEMRAARQAHPKLTVQIGHQDNSSAQNADVKAILGRGIMGKITEIHGHMYRNTPHDKPQWTRPVPEDVSPENVIWKSFLGGAPQRAFDPNRFINWRFWWDYSGGNFYENMCHQLAFWYKILELRIPTKVTTNGGLFLWKDGREVPDTMATAMVHADLDLMYTWDSAFGNNQLGVTEEVLGSDGTISRGEEIEYRPQRVNRIEPAPFKGQGVDKGQGHLDEMHIQNWLECIRTGKETNTPFELGFRVSIATRMAVEAYRQERVIRWDPGKEEIV